MSDAGDAVVRELLTQIEEQAAEIARLREALASAEHFVEFALRHTQPERATAHGAETVHSILTNHPFAKLTAASRAVEAANERAAIRGGKP